jgi:hypothetical protein
MQIEANDMDVSERPEGRRRQKITATDEKHQTPTCSL